MIFSDIITSLINGNKRLTPTSAIAAVQNAPSEVEDTTEMFMPQLTNPSIIRSAILSSSISSSPVPPTSSATLTYTLLNRSRTPMIFSSVSSSSSSTSTTPPKPQRSAAVVVNLRPIPSTTSTTIRPSVPNSTDKTNPTKIQTKNNTLQEPTTTAKSVLLTGLNQTSSNVTWIANNKLTSQLVTSNATSFDDADYEYYDYDETTLQKTSQSTTAIAKSTTKTLTSTARAITSPPVQVTTLTLRQDLVRQATTATTIATTTTLTPFLTTSTAAPNVGILNGLTRAGGAGISIGIASAAYAAIALFGIPFIGRRRRSINERNWLFASDYNPGYRCQWLEVVDN